MRGMMWTSGALVLALSLGQVGCDSDDSTTADGGGGGGSSLGNAPSQPSEVDNVATTVSASAGGEVTTQGVAIDVGAGALTEDLEITVTPIAESDVPADLLAVAASVIYDFGPDGTMFEQPVTVNIAFDAGATPQGKKAVVAWVDEEVPEWVVLEDSSVSGNVVSGSTDHFTPFAAIWVDDDSATGGSPDASSGEDASAEVDGGGEPEDAAGPQVTDASGSTPQEGVPAANTVNFGDDAVSMGEVTCSPIAFGRPRLGITGMNEDNSISANINVTGTAPEDGSTFTVDPELSDGGTSSQTFYYDSKNWTGLLDASNTVSFSSDGSTYTVQGTGITVANDADESETMVVDFNLSCDAPS